MHTGSALLCFCGDVEIECIHIFKTTTQALGQLHGFPSSSEATFKDMGKHHTNIQSSYDITTTNKAELNRVHVYTETYSSSYD